jgi:23S rRNA (adenine2503-C2)-methyltransferase
VTQILDLPPREAGEALAAWLAARGEPRYRLGQLVPRLWQRPVRRWEDATELPRALREALDAEWPLGALVAEVRRESADGTVKFLWRLPDGEAVESVLIPEGSRRTLCISSQAGCPLGCVFCATGTMGLRRDLAPWEIAGQARELLLGLEPVKPTNIVFMGMGEPLLNWPAVSTALTLLNDPAALGIGARHITVSTVGIIPALAELAKRPEQFRLAISLHAATSGTRRALMPIEKRYPLKDVITALDAFQRRVTFEYVLIEGMNDRDEDVALLAKHARKAGAMVNLLHLHPGGGSTMKATKPARAHAFAKGLTALGVEAVVRRSRGLDIEAACGQLRLARPGADAGGEVPSEPDGDVHQPPRVRKRARPPRP